MLALMLLLCFHGLDTSIGAQCNVIPSLMFANYHVDAAKWNVTIVWSEMERKCDSVVMKSAINKGLEDMKTVDVQICDGIFCTFEALNSYCPEDRQTYLKFHSIDPCYKDGCKFTTEVVSLQYLTELYSNPCDEVWQNGSLVSGKDREYNPCGQTEVCLSDFTRILKPDTKTSGCFCKSGIENQFGYCVDECLGGWPPYPLNIVATSDCESEEVIVAFLAEKQRKYSYSIFHGGKSIENKNLHIDVDSTSPRVYVRSPFRKSHLGVGIYNTSITDISANHSEMAPFAVTYEEKASFSEGDGTLYVYAYPLEDAAIIMFSVDANVTYSCKLESDPSFLPCSSPYIVRKGDGVDGLLEFTILAYKDGIPYPVGDDSFNIRV